MSYLGRVTISVLFVLLIAAGCKLTQTNSNTSSRTSSSPASRTSDDIIKSGSGVAKESPAAGKANVQGKVFFNEKPAADIEVKLCEKFSRFLSGCGGETFVAKTDANGEYLIKDVPPGIYEALTARVFNTPYYVFATSGIVGAAKYEIQTDETFFAPDTNLFKSDLKLLTPKAGAKVDGGFAVKWEPYPDAAYYKFSIYADNSSDSNYDYINKRVDGTSYALDKPLSPGSYTIKVQANNANDIKLAESADDIKFTVTSGTH